MKTLALLTFLVVFTGIQAQAGNAAALPTNTPPHLALRDQYNTPQQLSFPATNVTLLTIADRKGANQVTGWIAALKPAYARRVDIRGLADLSGVPGFLQGRVRRQFQEHYTYPVMLDWSGKSCEQFGFRPGVANVLVLDREGRVRARFYGPASEAALQSARGALEAALARAEGR